MKVYRYWAKVHVDDQGRPTQSADALTGAAGWSDDSLHAAEQSALERACRFAAMIRAGTIEHLCNRYAYLDRPVREPIIEELTVDGQRQAAITRNGYGAYILNSAHVLFADIDRRPTFRQSLMTAWNALRGRKTADAEQLLLDKLDDVARSHGLAMRVYRTRGGHRAAITSRTFDPNDPASRALLEACGSDPLYVQLCAGQQCYRARLSPKPWRIGLKRTPKFSFPYNDDAERQRFERWACDYEQAAIGWSACEAIADLGDKPMDPAVEPVLKLHDARACTAAKQLA